MEHININLIGSEVLYQAQKHINNDKFSGCVNIDAKKLITGDGESFSDCGKDSIKSFSVCVEVGASEDKMDFKDFSNEVINPAIAHIAEKLNDLPGKYVSPSIINFSDEGLLNCRLSDGSISIEVSYGYDSESHRNLLTIYTVAIQKSVPKVFLGGTCNGSLWRDSMQDKLKIGSYNPVVEDWTEECMAEEIKQREECDFCLYVITPRMTGTYSIAEVVDDSNKRPEKTIFAVVQFDESFGDDNDQITLEAGAFKSLDQVGKMVERNGGKYFKTLNEVVDYLNSFA